MQISKQLILTFALAGAVSACGGKKQSQGPSASPSATPAGASTGGAPKAPKPGGGGPSSEDVRTSDLDNNGVPEVYKYYKSVPDPERPGQEKTVLIRQDIDLTWDGKIDIWRYFTPGGVVEREEWDTDYDGNVDETRFFEGGVLVRTERDRNNDGRPDVIRYYKKGVIERKESDTNGDGKVDRWEYFAGRVLDRVGIDKDHDGTVDSWAKNDAAGAPAAE
ncbi:MAG: hypothetical protein KC933_14200 [Myxococcales bacterium]|nr:hypothetical protein [Myxococcales bacterium]MCB9648884.1 hypothetical protein [Deltaproteobacteria bacterium]